MSPEIKPLTSLRGIAAVLVLVYHLGIIGARPWPLDAHFFARGYLWVDLFFILSGFILAYVYGRRFEGKVNYTDYRDFLQRRLLRIYPLHFVTLLLFVPIGAQQLLAGPALYPAWSYLTSFVEHLLLVQSWYHHDVRTWNGPSWSISSEWAAYLLFPLFFWLVHRGPLVVASFLVTLGVIGIYVMSTFMPGQNLNILFGLGTLRCFADFSLGIFIHRLFRRGGRMIAAASHDLAAAAIVATIVLLLQSSSHDIWLIPGFAGLILAAAVNQGRLKRVLEVPILYHLGLISYSLYMTHWFMFHVALWLRERLPGDVPGPTAVAVLMATTLGATWLVSIVTYHQVELRFRRGWQRPIGRRQATPATARSRSGT